MSYIREEDLDTILSVIGDHTRDEISRSDSGDVYYITITTVDHIIPRTFVISGDAVQYEGPSEYSFRLGHIDPYFMDQVRRATSRSELEDLFWDVWSSFADSLFGVMYPLDTFEIPSGGFEDWTVSDFEEWVREVLEDSDKVERRMEDQVWDILRKEAGV